MTQITEKYLEDAIEAWLVEHSGYQSVSNKEYKRTAI